MTTKALIQALAEAAKSLNVPFCSASLGGMFGFCFSELPQVFSYADIASSDEELFKRFYHGMLRKGVYFAPSLYEAGFVSSAHQKEEIRLTQEAAVDVLDECLKVRA